MNENDEVCLHCFNNALVWAPMLQNGEKKPTILNLCPYCEDPKELKDHQQIYHNLNSFK